jgi:hypothetical protein
MISNCGHDENGKYSSGTAGDQTGTEWQLITWYNRPWNYVLRHSNKEIADLIADLATEAAKNDLIGYDQSQRYTFWGELVKSNYHPSQIKNACEADCSSGVLSIVKAVGYLLNIDKLKNVSIYGYTGNLRSLLKTAGFTVLSASKYLTSDKYLLKGDILLYENHHTAINVTDGSATQEKALTAKYFDKTTAGLYTTTADLNMRRSAGTEYTRLAVIPKGDTVRCYGYYNLSKDSTKWYLVVYNGNTGYCSSKYLTKK